MVSWFQGRRNGSYASMRLSPPRVRTEGIIVEDLGDEILVYDQMSARAHCLNGAAAQVWRASDGETGTDLLADRLDLSHEEVTQAIAELDSSGLLDGLPMTNGSTRREFSSLAVKTGLGVAAGSMVYSIVAPTAMAAVSPSVSQCLFYSAQSCDGCTNICGCCCCCQGCSSATQSACKICLPSHLCQVPGAFNSGCAGIPGVTGSCSSGPNCSATAPNGPLCGPDVPLVPSGSLKCCFPPCTNGSPTLTQCGNGSQPCNCTNESNPC